MVSKDPSSSDILHYMSSYDLHPTGLVFDYGLLLGSLNLENLNLNVILII